MSESQSELRRAVDPLLDIAGAAIMMTREFGRTFTPQQVRAMADRNKLPFFKDAATNKRMIFQSDLLAFYRRQQNAATREANKRLDAAAASN